MFMYYSSLFIAWLFTSYAFKSSYFCNKNFINKKLIIEYDAVFQLILFAKVVFVIWKIILHQIFYNKKSTTDSIRKTNAKISKKYIFF